MIRDRQKAFLFSWFWTRYSLTSIDEFWLIDSFVLNLWTLRLLLFRVFLGIYFPRTFIKALFLLNLLGLRLAKSKRLFRFILSRRFGRSINSVLLRGTRFKNLLIKFCLSYLKVEENEYLLFEVLNKLVSSVSKVKIFIVLKYRKHFARTIFWKIHTALELGKGFTLIKE